MGEKKVWRCGISKGTGAGTGAGEKPAWLIAAVNEEIRGLKESSEPSPGCRRPNSLPCIGSWRGGNTSPESSPDSGDDIINAPN
eukprot:1391722-Amorphochlora_amoeboformis.AAC.1